MAMNATSGGPGRQTVTAFFESVADADKAKADLAAAGFPAAAITTASGVNHAASAPAPEGQGIVKSLLDIFIFMPPHEKPTFEEALRRGGVAVSVTTEGGGYERAIDILDRDGAIDLDERETAWKGEGWSPQGSARAGGPGSAEQQGFEAENSHDPLVNPSANRDVRERIGTGTSDMTAATDIDPPSAADAPPQGAAVRDVSHGRRRVRSYSYAASPVPAGIDPGI